MKRVVSLGLLLAAVLLVQPVAGFAAWISQNSGTGSTTATSVAKTGAPTVTGVGANAVVSWPQGVLANGVVATGYVVKRTVGATSTTICTVAEPTRTCSDTAPSPAAAGYVVFATYGTNWIGPASNATSFTFDTDAPVTAVSSTPAPNANGYVTSAPTLTLTATDVSSSVASITYKIGPAAPVTVNSDSASFAVTAAGATNVTYSATDGAGNVEATKTYTVKRDGAAPTTTVSSSPAPNANGYVTAAPTLTLTASDNETSVVSITYRIGAGSPVTVAGSTAGFTVPGTGTTAVTYSATDAAGNVETTKTYTVRRDDTAPTSVTIKDPTQNGSYAVGNNGNGSWAKTCSNRGGICATATDADSPIAGLTYRLINNGNTCWNGTAFVAGTTCDVAMTFDSANNDWIGGPTRQQMGVSSTWSLTVTATNQAGLATTSTAIAFRTT